MSDSAPDAPTPDPALAGAGLSATGTTADEMSPGEGSPGTTYGDPGGTATAEQETTGAPDSEDAGQSADGDVEGR
jgi:hypothetical protein